MSRGSLRSVRGGDTPPYETPGTSLSDAEFRKAVGAVDFTVDARYAWDAGTAVARYLDGLKEGKILGRECRRCRRILVPPRMFCEECFRPTDRWVEVDDTGSVNTFSICYIRWDMVKLEDPEIPFVLDIDGATPGMGFMHKLGEVDSGDVRVGMQVEAVWRPEEERVGSILDIVYFRPREKALQRPATTRAAGGRRKTTGKKKPAAKRRRAG